MCSVQGGGKPGFAAIFDRVRQGVAKTPAPIVSPIPAAIRDPRMTIPRAPTAPTVLGGNLKV